MIEPAKAQKQIQIEVSSRQVTLHLGQSTAIFEATVYNDSDRFASFQLKLLAAGAEMNPSKPWYRLAPAVSSKIPAGDCTRFQIEVFDLPPLTQQFRGMIDLTAEVTSRELENQFDRQTLQLVIQGGQGQSPALALLVSPPQATPGDRVALMAKLNNPTSLPLQVTLRLSGLPEAWLPEGVQQTLSIPPGKALSTTFEALIPAAADAPSHSYPLRLEATGAFPPVAATESLYILPAGSLQVDWQPLEQSIPEQLGRWQNPTAGTTTFQVEFNNQSNVQPVVQLTVQELQTQRRWFWQPQVAATPAPTSAVLPPGVSLGEIPTPLPVGSTTIPLEIHRRLPWLGWSRRLRFEVTAQSLDFPVSGQNNPQQLQVYLFPVIPLWQQILVALLSLGLGALTWFLLADRGHRLPVNSVQFSGQGTEVLSSSDDQTIRRWRVEGQRLLNQGRVGEFNKAVRVARYRTVNNDQVALGLENGEIQVVNLLTGQRSRFTPDKDDRVLTLAFSQDARLLYSGHGSGLVLQWDTLHQGSEPPTPQVAYDTRFAIQALAPVGEDGRYLAIGGRYNTLIVQPTLPPNQKVTSKQVQASQFVKLNYPAGGSTDYIASLSTAGGVPTLLAVSDTQGRVSLWNMQACLQAQGRCDALENPWMGHGGSAVRSIALTFDGCFMASGGDDGAVKLWALDGQGLRQATSLEGRVLGRLRQPLNSVDVIQRRNRIWVTAGGDDGKVRLYSVPLSDQRPSAGSCPTLSGGGS